MSTWLPASIAPDEWKIHRALRGRSSTDALIASLGAHQHRVVARRQLRALGVSQREIEMRVRGKRLHPVWDGVYAVGCATLTPVGRRMAAVLAAGAGARLGGWSGATQRGWLPETPGQPIDVAIPPTRRIALDGISVRRTHGDSTLADGVPTHAPAFLLLDIAVRNGPEILEWAWRQAIYRRDLEVSAVGVLLAERAGAPGTPALRALYERRAQLVGELRNRFELLMVGVIREAGLPEPLCNAPWEWRSQRPASEPRLGSVRSSGRVSGTTMPSCSTSRSETSRRR